MGTDVQFTKMYIVRYTWQRPDQTRKQGSVPPQKKDFNVPETDEEYDADILN